ncbi:MAG: hypothetical protein H7070_13955 [Saprospiraceae bacterium]|nr:hypothetical protein [Pyrinomonadaceae bacterium]
MLIALEGSSPTTSGSNNYKYYVWQAYCQTGQSPKLYVEGPAMFSMGDSLVNIRKMADRATVFAGSSIGKIFLIGWSRGAAACIQVAYDLKRSGGTKVDAMFLFDAVDQDTSTNSDLKLIPDNVINVYHAIAIKKTWLDRQLFPTCGKRAAKGVNLVMEKFNTSHGGIAGAGDDDAGSKLWMWEHLTSEGAL